MICDADVHEVVSSTDRVKIKFNEPIQSGLCFCHTFLPRFNPPKPASKVNPKRAGTELFLFNMADIMAGDVLGPCAASGPFY